MPKNNAGPRLLLNAAGVYEIRWTEDRRSHRRSTHSRDLPAAQEIFGKWLLTRNASKMQAPTVRSILDAYLAEHVEERVSDKDRQRDCANNLASELGDLTPADLSPEVMLGYRRRREQGKVNGHAVGAGTLRRELNCLVAAINHAVRHRRLSAADVPHIDLPQPPPPKDLWLTEEEADQFWAASEKVGGRGFLFVAIALETASRKKAIQQLRWSQVDLSARLIHFQNDGGLRTKKRRVAVPMSDRLFTVLRAAKQDAVTEWVLMSPYSIQHWFDRVKAMAVGMTGNPKFDQVSPHVLRHTWATLAARAGVPMFDIAGVLGDTVQTVQRVYAHHSPDHLRGAVNFRAQAARAPGQHDHTAADTLDLNA